MLIHTNGITKHSYFKELHVIKLQKCFNSLRRLLSLLEYVV